MPSWPPNPRRTGGNSLRIRWAAALLASFGALYLAAGGFGFVRDESGFYLPVTLILMTASAVSWRGTGWWRKGADGLILATALVWMLTAVRDNSAFEGGFLQFMIGVVALAFLLVVPPTRAAVLVGGLGALYNALVWSVGQWRLELSLNSLFLLVLAWVWFWETWNNAELQQKNEALVAELKERNRHWNTLALQDSLTVIPNRRYFDQACGRLWDEAVPGQRNVSLLLGDLDFFKAINDQYGHAVGDEVLRWVAARLAAQLRPPGFLARVGGEEFAVLLPGTGPQDARAVAERLVQNLGVPGIPGLPQGTRITMSWGVASVNPSEANPGALFEAADRALYQAKKNGRNRVESVDPGSL